MMTTTGIVYCERCDQPAEVDWVEVHSWGRPIRYIMGDSRCLTAGCVNNAGYRNVLPPDVPGELTRFDRMWLDRQFLLCRDI